MREAARSARAVPSSPRISSVRVRSAEWRPGRRRGGATADLGKFRAEFLAPLPDGHCLGARGSEIGTGGAEFAPDLVGAGPLGPTGGPGVVEVRLEPVDRRGGGRGTAVRPTPDPGDLVGEFGGAGAPGFDEVTLLGISSSAAARGAHLLGLLGGQALSITLTSRAGQLDVDVVSGSISRYVRVVPARPIIR
ncbi:hypothetical protein [Rhodococcus koreensis]|uniref:hypothetical protein n=1 Tax=Rhodococcus koreensis TaxID=99653 RepID=UPI00197CBD3D|nr:hypothetical protein [Rhodococcus koreensis]QSE84695.1 hypothetical protein JWS14_39080 [Rhodococcus koreensis]